MSIDYLHECVNVRNLPLLAILLENVENINAKEKRFGDTLLHNAVNKGFCDCVDLLLSKGADVNLQDNFGNTPLHESIRNEYIVRALLNKGAKVNTKNLSQETPLQLAVKEGNVDVINLLLSNGASVNVQSEKVDSPLNLAIAMNSLNLTTLLLDNGADMHIRSLDGSTSLQLACEVNSEPIVRLLIKKGFDLDLLNQFNTSFPPLYYVVSNDNFELMRYLIRKGANPNLRDNFGGSILHWILDSYTQKRESQKFYKEDSFMKMLEYCISYGVDINIKNKQDETPLFNALSSQHYDAIHILMSKGAEFEIKNIYGNTALHISNSTYISKMLLEKRAIVNLKNINGETPLDCALSQNNARRTELLLDWGAIDYNNENYKTMRNNNVLSYVDSLPQWDYNNEIDNVRNKHLIKLTAIRSAKKGKFDCQLSKEDMMIYNKMYFMKCLQELERMRYKEVTGTYSFLDVLTKFRDPYYATHDRHLKYRLLRLNERKFPIYRSLLIATFKRAELRSKLIIEALSYFNVPVLPLEIRREILTFLNHEDLCNVINAVSYKE